MMRLTGEVTTPGDIRGGHDAQCALCPFSCSASVGSTPHVADRNMGVTSARHERVDHPLNATHHLLG